MIVFLESPYAGDVRRNICYLRACLHDSLRRGESPFASHAIYTQPGVLVDEIQSERALGIRAGGDFRTVAAKTVVYTDLGISMGMQQGIDIATTLNQPIEYRSIGCPDDSWPGWAGF